MQGIVQYVLRSVIFACLLATMGQAATADNKLVLGVHPYLPPAEIHKRFQPLAALLSKAVGQPVEVRVGGDYAKHIEAIGKNQIDIAFLGPVGYVEVTQQYGRKPMLGRFEVNHSPFLYGVIITRQDTPLKSIAELREQSFAFGDPDSTMSHIVPRYMMLQAGLPRGATRQYKFLGSHKNVALAVLSGDYAAGAVKKEVYDEFSDKGLRALAVSEGVPDHIFVTRSDLSADLIQRLRNAMLTLQETPQGAAALKQLHKHLTALVPAMDKDYDGLRRIVKEVNSVKAADDK